MNIIKRYTVKSPDGNNQTTFKIKIIKMRGCSCEHCHRKLNLLLKRDVVLDHKMPVCLGGAEFSEENVQLLCPECNKRKCDIDNRIIRMFLGLRIIRKYSYGAWRCYVPYEEMKQLYEKLYKYAVEARSLDNKWLESD